MVTCFQETENGNQTKPNHGIAHLITTTHATIKYMPTMLFAGGKNLSDSDSDVRRIGRQSNLMVETTVCTSELRYTWSNEIESCFAIHSLNVINESAQIGAIQRLRFSACHKIAVYSGDNHIIQEKSRMISKFGHFKVHREIECMPWRRRRRKK